MKGIKTNIRWVWNESMKLEIDRIRFIRANLDLVIKFISQMATISSAFSEMEFSSAFTSKAKKEANPSEENDEINLRLSKDFNDFIKSDSEIQTLNFFQQ